MIKENENQTKKYSEYSKDYPDPILVYLSNNDKCESPDFICITYQDLLEYVIEPLYYYAENENTKQLCLCSARWTAYGDNFKWKNSPCYFADNILCIYR